METNNKTYKIRAYIIHVFNLLLSFYFIVEGIVLIIEGQNQLQGADPSIHRIARTNIVLAILEFCTFILIFSICIFGIIKLISNKTDYKKQLNIITCLTLPYNFIFLSLTSNLFSFKAYKKSVLISTLVFLILSVILFVLFILIKNDNITIRFLNYLGIILTFFIGLVLYFSAFKISEMHYFIFAILILNFVFYLFYGLVPFIKFDKTIKINKVAIKTKPKYKSNLAVEINELHELKDRGIITEEQFKNKVDELMNNKN